MTFELTEDERKLVARALTVLSNNIRYSLTAPPQALDIEVKKAEQLKEKFVASA